MPDLLEGKLCPSCQKRRTAKHCLKSKYCDWKICYDCVIVFRDKNFMKWVQN